MDESSCQKHYLKMIKSFITDLLILDNYVKQTGRSNFYLIYETNGDDYIIR